MGSSTDPIRIDTIESSIQTVETSWQRRQRWNLSSKSTNQVDNTGRAKWRTQLANFLESTPIHITTILLLLLDLLLTVIELSSSKSSSCSSSTKKKKDDTREVWFHWVEIAILGLLCAKSLGLAVGLGKSFFRNVGHVVDGGVVLGALVLEGFFNKVGGGLIVVVSLWRAMRMIESAFALTGDAIEAQIKDLQGQLDALKQHNQSTG
ncbi:hypothetical protein RJ641_034178 [Dillenia turbinata]|uniref:Voltage-gated hydrogen channel 1 n=1 Tax=Dillenia turbinata TaxID=194707 RepID=A0AAN8VL99_9MAGN